MILLTLKLKPGENQRKKITAFNDNINEFNELVAKFESKDTRSIIIKPTLGPKRKVILCEDIESIDLL